MTGGAHISPSPERGRGGVLIAVVGVIAIIAGVCALGWSAWMTWGTDAVTTPKMEQKVSEYRQENPLPTATASTEDIRVDDPPVETKKAYGETIGIIHVPSWNNMEIPIIEGSGQEILDAGNAGHYEETAYPGEVGNFSVAGHRRTYGSNFRHLDKLGEGDVVIVETDSAWLVYRWTSSEVVDPSHVESILPVPNSPGTTPTQRLMTMTTCYPEYGNSERLVAHFVLDHWVPKSSGVPSELGKK